jgi:hypothetical protein
MDPSRTRCPSRPPTACPARTPQRVLAGRRAPTAGAGTRSCTAGISLEDRLEHDLQRGLHDAVADSGNRQRPLLRRARLGYQHPPGRQRTIPPVPQLAGQLAEQPGNPVLLDVGQGDLVDARSAVITAHHDPRAPKDITADDLVHQRMEPPPGIGLGRPVKRMLQGTDRISRDTPGRSRSGGTSHDGTHRASPPHHAHRRSSGPSLTGGYAVRPAQAVLRPPPTPTRPAIHFPGSPVIGRHAPAARSAGCRAGEGLPSSRRHYRCVPRPTRRGVPHGCASRHFTASMAFAPISRGSALPCPPRRTAE